MRLNLGVGHGGMKIITVAYLVITMLAAVMRLVILTNTVCGSGKKYTSRKPV